MSEDKIGIREAVEAAYENIVEEAPSEAPVERDIPEPVSEDRQEETKTENTNNAKAEPEEVADDVVDIEPLQHWAKEEIDAYNELDDRAKMLYMKRHKAQQASFTKKTQGFAEERRIAENFKKALVPHEEHLRSLGIDPLIAFDKLLATEKLFRTGSAQQKINALQKIAIDYGINLNLPQQQQQYEEQQPQYSPETLALLQKVQTLEQRQQVIEHDRIQREYKSLEGQITSFQHAKDEKGQSKYPHFEELRLNMSEKLQKGVAQTLEQAYEQSFWENEDLRQQYINVQYNSKLKEADILKKTVASKKAGFNVKGSGGSSSIESPTTSQLGIRDAALRAYEKQEKRQRI